MNRPYDPLAGARPGFSPLFGRTQEIGDQKDLLLKWQAELLKDLEFFTAIKEAGAYVDAGKSSFDVRQQDYKAAADSALERLRDKDQENACKMVGKLRELERGWKG